jgi:hypothetical protein
LTLRATPAAGARLKCPKCSTVFPFNDTGDEDASPPPSRRPRPDAIEDGESVRRRSRSAARASDPDDEDEEPRPRKSKKVQKGSNAGLIIGLSVGGGVLALGLVAVLVISLVRSRTDGGNQQAAANPAAAAPQGNNPPNANQPVNNPAGNNPAGNNPAGNNPGGNNRVDNKPIEPAPVAPVVAAPPVKLGPAELYGDQGGEAVAPADAGLPNTVMRARRDDTFYKLSNPREGQTSGRGPKRPALLVDYEVVRRGKFDGGTLVIHTDDGGKADVALQSIVSRDHGTIELVGVKWFGNIAVQRNATFPKTFEMYITRGDDRYRPPSKFLVSNSAVLGQMKVTTRARDWTAEEIERYSKPPPNFTTPNVHLTIGEDVPALPAAGGKFRFVEPDGRLLGLEYHLGEWNKEKCVGGLVPIFSADQPPSKPSRVVARPGYAVAGAEVHSGKLTYAIRLLFRRVKADGSLDPADAYAGDWIGTPPPGEAQTLVNDGRRVMGIHFQQGAVVDRFALVVAK